MRLLYWDVLGPVLLQQHYNEGIRLYREEKLEGAIAEWRAVLQYDPNHEAAKKYRASRAVTQGFPAETTKK